VTQPKLTDSYITSNIGIILIKFEVKTVRILIKLFVLNLLLGGMGHASDMEKANEIAAAILHQAPREVQSYFGDYSQAAKASLIGPNYTDHVKKSLESQIHYMGEQRELNQGNKSLTFEIDTLTNILKGNLEILNQNENHGLVTLINPWYQANYTSFVDPLEYIFNGISDFILRGGQENLGFARQRFEEYVQGDDQNPPLIDGIIAELIRLKKKYREQGKTPILPCKLQLNKMIAPGYIEEIIKEIKKSLALDNEALFEKFERQMQDYVRFIQDDLLPEAPENPSLPRSVYEALLRVNAITDSPEGLMARAHKDFETTYAHFIELAQKVATKHDFTYENPVQVLKVLTQKLPGVGSEEEALAMYTFLQRRIEEIIKSSHLITLPNVPLSIRKATAAEVALLNAPQYRPAELFENMTNVGEFVTTGWKEFKHPFAATILLAHEGRPGHDQQFSTVAELLKEKRLNYISGMLVQQMPYIEGWGLYAEDLMMPHLTMEEQLGGLKMRLLRIARMFLDPEVNTGKISFEDIKVFLQEKLGFEEAHARVEAERYSFKMPAQAITYYYGLTLLLDLRKDVESALGQKFNLGKFNDSIMRCGFMPVDQMKDYIIELMNA
jgi:hypothetical protein